MRAKGGAIFKWLRDTRALFLLNYDNVYLEIFSRILLISNYVIFLVQICIGNHMISSAIWNK